MKKFLILLIFTSVWVAGSAQDRETLEERIERWKADMAEFNSRSSEDREVQSVTDTLSWLQAQKALNDSLFVVEAYAVTFKYGTRVQVNSTVNFVSMNGDRAVIQISPSSFHSGPNGVGGITVEGRASNVKKSYDRKGRMRFSMNVTGNGVNATVSLTVNPGTNRVVVSVSPTFNSNDVRLEGRIVPYKFSRAFEGLSL